MEKGMKESNIEGLASHGGPESCASPRKRAGEAFDRGKCRQGIEPRNTLGVGCRRFLRSRKATRAVALSQVTGQPRVVEDP